MSDHGSENGKGESQHGAHGGGGGHGGGHGSGGGHEEAHEGAPEWLISFADNVTLMMGFFVILLAMNMKTQTVGGGMGGEDKNGSLAREPDMLDAVLAIRQGFNNPVLPESENPADLPLIRRVLERQEEGFAKNDGVPGASHNVESIRPSRYERIGAAVPFDESSSTTMNNARDKVRSIAAHFGGTRTILEIRGHCSVKEAQSSPDQGMTLCFERSMAVATELKAQGIDPRRIRIILCGDHDRMKEISRGPDDWAENQRVEVTATDEIMPTHVPAARLPEKESEKHEMPVAPSH